jgi:hypothetical protein
LTTILYACRSYYKCTSSHCSAKKHVEKSTDDPEMLIVTYEGAHLHGPHPLLRRLQPPAATAADQPDAAGDVVSETLAKRKKASKPSPPASEGYHGAADGIRPSNGMSDEEVGGGSKPQGRQMGRSHGAVQPVATDSWDGSAATKFSSSESPPSNWSGREDFNWSLEALLPVQRI